jgi:hypothetical protein
MVATVGVAVADGGAVELDVAHTLRCVSKVIAKNLYLHVVLGVGSETLDLACVGGFCSGVTAT